MAVPEGVIQALIRNDMQYVGSGTRTFELLAVSGVDAARTLFPIWDPTQTFEQRLASTGSDPRALMLATSLVLDVPLLVGAYRRGHTGHGDPTDLVVFDGCHRILAIAIRVQMKLPLPSCVGIFVAV